jgi:hypothetical protein
MDFVDNVKINAQTLSGTSRIDLMKTLSNIHLFECEKRILKVINIREEQFDK